MAAVRVTLDVDHLVRLYESGYSVNKLAHELGVSRSVVCLRLQSRALEPRGQSEAERLKWASMSADARERQVARAHDATRGKARSAVHTLRVAAGKAARVSRTGVRGRFDDEGDLARALALLGREPVKQHAVDRYNVDLAFPMDRVAVEVVSNYPTAEYVPVLRKRTKHLLDAGWSVLFVDVSRGPQRRPVLMPEIAKKVVAHLDLARGQKGVHGHYRVIGRQGEDTAGLRRYLHDLPRVGHA